MDRRQFLFANSTAWAALGAASFPSLTRTVIGGAVADTAEDTLAGPARGPWRRLFLDAAVIERSEGLSRVFHTAKKLSDKPVLQRDEPWEGVSAIIGPYVYGTVFWEGEVLRMWYQFLNKGNHVGYAESRDGIHWTKPKLGIIAFEGSKTNNIVVSAFDPAATGGGYCHNPSVIRCPSATNPQERYVLFGFDSKAGHARAAYSPDGLHWSYPPETEKKLLFTSSDVVNFGYDPYESRYFATWKTRNRRGRAVGIAWSDDGRTWSKPFAGPIFTADDLDPDATQIYGMPAFSYQGLYIGQPWIYNARYFRYGEYAVDRMHEAQDDSPRTMDVQLAWSWDLVNWTRPPKRDVLIPRGKESEWDAGMIVTARAPVIVGDQLFFYYGGCAGVHDQPRVRAAIGVAAMRLDGFCSMRAGSQEGWLVTRREPFHEPAVTINATTANHGTIVAEIVDRHDQAIPGFGRQDCLPFQGDSVRHELRWKSRQFPAEPRYSDYKIRFWLQHAELFSYLPCGLDPTQHDLARFPTAGP